MNSSNQQQTHASLVQTLTSTSTARVHMRLQTPIMHEFLIMEEDGKSREAGRRVLVARHLESGRWFHVNRGADGYRDWPRLCTARLMFGTRDVDPMTHKNHAWVEFNPASPGQLLQAIEVKAWLKRFYETRRDRLVAEGCEFVEKRADDFARATTWYYATQEGAWLRGRVHPVPMVQWASVLWGRIYPGVELETGEVMLDVRAGISVPAAFDATNWTAAP